MIIEERERLIKEFFTPLLIDWYIKSKRDLPWRKTKDPYNILVSEIMLQQTTVATVIPVYLTFLENFPTIKSVVEASLADVKTIIDPLGYKRRGEYIKRICEVIEEKYKGHLPSAEGDLLSLPGIGRYTAGAIRSFAFNLDASVVDTNVQRILDRLFENHLQKLTGSDLEKEWWRLSELLLPRGKACDFNNALMDFGSIICVPVKPLCRICPMTNVCQYYQSRPKQRKLFEFIEYNK